MTDMRKSIVIGVALAILLALIVGVLWTYVGSAEKRAAFFCAQEQGDYSRILCLKPYVETITTSRSATEAATFIHELQTSDFVADCHVLLHFVGEAHVEKSASLGEALATCPVDCFEGCHHGAVEGHVSEHGVLDVQTVCTPVSENPTLFRQCLHGLGHGLLRHNSAQVEVALSQCSTLQGTAVTTCSDGVMMEYIDAQLYKNYETFLKEFPATCERFRNQPYHFDACMNNVGWGLMVATGHDIERGKLLCEQFDDPRDQKLCLHYIQVEIDQNRAELGV